VSPSILSLSSQVLQGALAEARSHAQHLGDALGAARECVVTYNVKQGEVCGHMGAAFEASCTEALDAEAALMAWQEWKGSMQYESVAAGTNPRMQAAVAAGSQRGLAAMLGMHGQQQQQEEEGGAEALVAAGEAVDSGAALHACNPMALVPAMPLVRAAERLMQAAQARVTALQNACTVYEGTLRVHEAESQCLDMQGGKYALKEQAVAAIKEAGEVHKKAREAQEAERFGALGRSGCINTRRGGTTAEELRASIKEKRKALSDAAAGLQAALGSLLEVQDYFPEVCAHIKPGLPHELVPVWRPDLGMEMFESGSGRCRQARGTRCSRPA
jgi:hypothetical protein